MRVPGENKPIPLDAPRIIDLETGRQVFKDGDKFCAVENDFVNLQESPAGFGDTPEEALKVLDAEIAKPAAEI
jgi:hypothetical protein